jgi:transcriptional regulator with XRE-family HTH domain
MRKKSGSKSMKARQISDADIVIGERIKAQRNLIEMSQDDLGQALGVSFQQIQKYEKGINRISSGRLTELATTLQCSVTDLVGGADKTSAKSTPSLVTSPRRKVLQSSTRWRKSQVRRSGGTSSTSLRP